MPVILSSATTDRHSPTLPLFHRCQRSPSLPRRVNFGSLEDDPRFVHFSSADPELHGRRHHEVVDGGVVSALGCNRSPAVAAPFYTPGRATIRIYLLGEHDPYDCAVAPNLSDFTLKEEKLSTAYTFKGNPHRPQRRDSLSYCIQTMMYYCATQFQILT